VIATMLFGGGEILVVAIGAILAILLLAYACLEIAKAPNENHERSRSDFFALLFLGATILAATLTMGTWMSVSHGNTVEARRDLTQIGFDDHEMGYSIKSVNVKRHTAEITMSACTMKFDLHKTADGYRLLMPHTDGAVSVILPFMAQRIANVGCYGYNATYPSYGPQQYACDDPLTAVIEGPTCPK
jgi:hypothetical protein